MFPLLIAIALFLVAYLLARRLDRRRGSEWHKDILAAGLLALACIGFFWRVLFGDATMPADGGDLLSFLWPTYRFAADSLRAGQWPLWNPHLYGGAPHVADIQAGFLYPAHVALFLLKAEIGPKSMQALSILHFWWAGLGMYAFMRSLRWGPDGDEQVGRSAALAAGVAFAFCDALLIHFGNLNYVAVASWLPWVMACFARGLEGRKGGKETREQEAQSDAQPSANTAHRSPLTDYRSLGWAALGGLLLGIATLAGHIQATLFIAVAAVIYGLFWLYGEMRDGANQRKSESASGQNGEAPSRSPLPASRSPLLHLIAALAALALVAFLVAAPALLPALQSTPYLARADWTYQDSVGYSLSPAQWIGVLVPGFFGRGPQLHWGPWPRVEVGYLGVLPLVLAALAILARRERRTWTLAGLSVVAFLLALGIYSLPHGWLSLVPGFNLLRAPARFVLLMDFGLAALAGLGFHVLVSSLAEGENWRALTRLVDGLGWVAKAVLAIVVPLTLLALLLAQDKDPEVYIRVAVAAIAIMLFTAFLLASLGLIAARKAGWARPRTIATLALLLIFLDLASTGAYNDIGSQDATAGYTHPEIVAFLAQQEPPFRIDARTGIDQAWQPNTALIYRMDDVWGIVNPSILGHYERYWEGMGSRSSRLYDFLNARFVIAAKDVVLDWDKFELAFDGDPALNVYRNRNALPRAFIVHDGQAVADDEAAWEAIHAAGFDPARTVVVQGATEALPPRASQAVAGDPAPVQAVRVSPGELVFEADVDSPGFLVLSEVWYPGWRAEMSRDGGPWQETDLLRANYAFRAVPLAEAGDFQVRLRFQPANWTAGLLLAALGLLLILIGGVLAWRRGRSE